MPVFLPFRAIRPSKDKVAEFSAKTSDFKNQEEIVADMLSNTQSYYYVTKRFLVFKDNENVEYHFSNGAKYLSEKILSNDLIVEFEPCYYIYRQTDFLTNRTYTGFIGLADIKELENNIIKKHEYTKQQREEYLYKQLHYTGVLGEPVLVGYKNNDLLNKIIEEHVIENSIYDFKTKDNKQHQIWKISESRVLEEIYHLFNEIEAFYIADGHHRCASVHRNYIKNPIARNRYFMIYLLEENQFKIESFHRLISDIGKIDIKELEVKISSEFKIESYELNKLYIPQKHSEFGLLTRDFSLILTYRGKEKNVDPDKNLDVNILENYFLKPLFSIDNPRSDHRLSFIASTENTDKILNLLRKGEIDMIISNYPVSFNEVKQVADANKVMPPKSTYIEPKLRGGLIIQQF